MKRLNLTLTALLVSTTIGLSGFAHEYNPTPKIADAIFTPNTALLKKNNPCSIRNYGLGFYGSIATDTCKWEAFDTPENGLRAFIRIVFFASYFGSGQTETIRDFVTLYGSPEYSRYMATLAGLLGVGVDEPLHWFLEEKENIKKFTCALALLENGKEAEKLAEHYFDNAFESAKISK